MRRRSRRSSLEYRFEILEGFPDAVSLEVEMESLLGEAEVSSLQTRVLVGKPYNF
jgi:hypothetical protein